MHINRLTSNPLPKEKESTAKTSVTSGDTKIKPARGTSKPLGAGKPKVKSAEAGGSAKPVRQAAFVLVPGPTTMVYANPKYSGPNAIEGKTTGEMVLSSEGQPAVIRVTRSTQRTVERGESSQVEDTRERSVCPGHDGETPRMCFLFV
jgi:hypothetical protein